MLENTDLQSVMCELLKYSTSEPPYRRSRVGVHASIISCSVCFELPVEGVWRLFERSHDIDCKPQSEPLPFSALKTINEILHFPS